MSIRFRRWAPKDNPEKVRIYVDGVGADGEKVWLEKTAAGGVAIKRQGSDGRVRADAEALALVAAEVERQGFVAPEARLRFDDVLNLTGTGATRGRANGSSAASFQERGWRDRGPARPKAEDRQFSAELDSRLHEAATRPFEKMVIPERVEIVVDHREPAELVEMLASHPMVDVRVAALELGDIGLNPSTVDGETQYQVLVERKDCTKAPSDFEKSVTEEDKRFFGQLARMKISDSLGVLLIEGDVYRNSMGMEFLQQIDGALSYAAVIQRISIVPTLSLRHSAYTIIKMATHARSGLATPLALRSAKPSNARDRACFVLEGIPGVSAGLATQLIDRFGSIARITTASITELMEVPGVGKKRAAAIAEVMQTEFTKSQA